MLPYGYSDPQTEILRRQDFDLRISMMTLDDVIAYLDDDTRDVSDYEILKIKSLYGDSVKVAELLALHREKRDTDYLQDGEYKELSNDVDILRQIKSMELTRFGIHHSRTKEKVGEREMVG